MGVEGFPQFLNLKGAFARNLFPFAAAVLQNFDRFRLASVFGPQLFQLALQLYRLAGLGFHLLQRGAGFPQLAVLLA